MIKIILICDKCKVETNFIPSPFTKLNINDLIYTQGWGIIQKEHIICSICKDAYSKFIEHLNVKREKEKKVFLMNKNELKLVSLITSLTKNQTIQWEQTCEYSQYIVSIVGEYTFSLTKTIDSNTFILDIIPKSRSILYTIKSSDLSELYNIISNDNVLLDVIKCLEYINA